MGTGAVFATIVCAALVLAGCGEDETAAPETAPSSGVVIPGGGLTVAEAIATDAEPPLAVAGWIVGSGDQARLCSGYEPDADEPCTEPSLVLEGAEDAEAGTQVTVFGVVEGDTFVVAPTVQG